MYSAQVRHLWELPSSSPSWDVHVRLEQVRLQHLPVQVCSLFSVLLLFFRLWVHVPLLMFALAWSEKFLCPFFSSSGLSSKMLKWEDQKWGHARMTQWWWENVKEIFAILIIIVIRRRKYLQPNDEIKGPLQNSSIPGQRNGRGLCESGARHSLWNPHRPTQWATSCTTS